MKPLIRIFILVLCGTMLCPAQRPNFNKSTDILVAQFDGIPDPDDVHSTAALGCMLLHNDLVGVNYFAVAGAKGTQGGTYINPRSLFALCFGEENTFWTDANADWSTSASRVKSKVKPILLAGGKVFVQEAGQSNFTRVWVQRLINESVPLTTIKSNVIVVQHSKWNEDHTTPADLTWVMEKTNYVAIDDGNLNPGATPNRGDDTPNFKSANDATSYLTSAKSTSNPNTGAKALWTEADKICDALSYKPTYSPIPTGGVDFSDCVENIWIFNIGTTDAGSITNFWNRYVTNSTSELNMVIDAKQFDTESHPGNDNNVRIETNNVGYLRDGNWIAFKNFNFGTGSSRLEVTVAAGTGGGAIELRTGSSTGTLLASISVPPTGGWQVCNTFGANVSVSGIRDLYFVFKKTATSSTSLVNLKTFVALD